MHFDPSSRSRLNLHDLPRFTEATLFHSVARVLCAADCLPRKELFESWEVARRARRRLRGQRVVDLACGHGLIAHLMMLLDPTIERAVAADRRLPDSAGKVAAALAERWPRLQGRVSLVESPIAEVEVRRSDIVVSCHGCGPLTDQVLDSALGAVAPVAVLPCCQASATGDAGGLDGWLDNALAIDVTRAARLRAHGYRVHTQRIPAAMTAKNRLLLGEPPDPLRGAPSPPLW
jgi:hypothetical protein